ncbi:hypothetical protein [Photobacterium kishitanii]|uniref:Uncharacterized protein n=1 Tax=Photobacterium kishitanii TaxID=318456 RepID=A0A2T3KMD7_9GAMM|nr:hypothetical protein [Photobacterium kishitanii]PSV00948.1 hypothetical protein C9J27_02680 [Photobacterium kishitanii]
MKDDKVVELNNKGRGLVICSYFCAIAAVFTSGATLVLALLLCLFGLLDHSVSTFNRKHLNYIVEYSVVLIVAVAVSSLVFIYASYFVGAVGGFVSVIWYALAMSLGLGRFENNIDTNKHIV